jgi:hypothetical protein
LRFVSGLPMISIGLQDAENRPLVIAQRRTGKSKIFYAGQCVRVVLGGLARVDKSDKVEAAGCRYLAMGKAQAPVPDIGLAFADFSEF